MVETISQIGASAGGTLLPYLTAKCLGTYGLRGSILLLGAWACNLIPCGSTMRAPVSSKPKEKEVDLELLGSRTDKVISGSGNGWDDLNRRAPRKPDWTEQTQETVPCELNVGGHPESSLIGEMYTRTGPGPGKISDCKGCESRTVADAETRLDCPAKKFGQIGVESRDARQRSGAGEGSKSDDHSKLQDVYIVQSEGEDDLDLEQCGTNLLGKHQGTHLESDEPGQPTKGSEDSVESSGKTDTSSTTKKVCKLISSVFDFRSLKDEPILTFIFLPCQFLLETSFISWMFFMVSYGVSVGMTEQTAVFLPMAGSFGGLGSRVMLAVFMYKRPDLSPHLHAFLAGVTAIGLLLYPVRSSLGFLVFISFVVGFGYYGANSCYYPAIAMIVKKENFPGAMSYSFFLCGLGITISGPITGISYSSELRLVTN